MRDCPKCGAPVDGVACNRCGFAEKSGDVEFIPVTILGQTVMARRCCNVYLGQRCAKIGNFSPSTHGSDRWYCADHDPSQSTHGGARTAPPGGFASLRDVIRRANNESAEARAEREAIQTEGK